MCWRCKIEFFSAIVDQIRIISPKRQRAFGAEAVGEPGGLRGLFEGAVLLEQEVGEGFEKAIGY